MALRALGRLEESLEALAIAERELPEHGALLHDLAIVRLSVAMTLQEMERFEEARKLMAASKRVFSEYRPRAIMPSTISRPQSPASSIRAGLSKRAITALGYLQEAIASSRASTSLVMEVREYIVSLRTYPKRNFLPLQLTASPERFPGP